MDPGADRVLGRRCSAAGAHRPGDRPLSQWLQAALVKAGYDAVLQETRHVKATLSAMIVKTDRRDAHGIAQLLRVGMVPAGALTRCGQGELPEPTSPLISRRSGLYGSPSTPKPLSEQGGMTGMARGPS